MTALRALLGGHISRIPEIAVEQGLSEIPDCEDVGGPTGGAGKIGAMLGTIDGLFGTSKAGSIGAGGALAGSERKRERVISRIRGAVPVVIFRLNNTSKAP